MAGGVHLRANSAYRVTEYSLEHDDLREKQPNWRWCKKCHLLFHESASLSGCSAGRQHDGLASSEYALTTDT